MGVCLVPFGSEYKPGFDGSPVWHRGRSFPGLWEPAPHPPNISAEPSGSTQSGGEPGSPAYVDIESHCHSRPAFRGILDAQANGSPGGRMFEAEPVPVPAFIDSTEQGSIEWTGRLNGTDIPPHAREQRP